MKIDLNKMHRFFKNPQISLVGIGVFVENLVDVAHPSRGIHMLGHL